MVELTQEEAVALAEAFSIHEAFYNGQMDEDFSMQADPALQSAFWKLWQAERDLEDGQAEEAAILARGE